VQTDFTSEERKYHAIDKRKQGIKEEEEFNIPGVVMT
jgi:hypothetical protein